MIARKGTSNFFRIRNWETLLNTQCAIILFLIQKRTVNQLSKEFSRNVDKSKRGRLAPIKSNFSYRPIHPPSTVIIVPLI